MTLPLSLALRSATTTAHEQAEHSSFIDDLMAGRSCRAAFTALMVQQQVIYTALEEVIEEHYLDDPIVAAIHDPRLDRRGAIRRDLDHLVGTDHPERIARGIHVTPAAQAYAARLRTGHDRAMILGQHYVRYLGDLSGGQIIATLVQRHYGVSGEALHFYRFDGIDKYKPYKDEYRARLDALELTPGERDRVLERAVEAFELSRAVFADLAAARDPRHTAAGVAA